MTETEFSEWLKHHATCFPSLSKWIEGLPAEPPAGVPSRREVMSQWFATLRDVDFELAKAASNMLHNGEEEEPYGWDRVPAKIRTIARKLRRSRPDSARLPVEAKAAYACEACRDEGRRSVWRPEAMAAASPQRFAEAELHDPTSGDPRPRVIGEPFTLYRMSTACPCPAGDRFRRNSATFDPGRMLECWHMDRAEQQELIEFMAKRERPEATAGHLEASGAEFQ